MINSAVEATYDRAVSRTSFFSRFIEWSRSQQENRLLWLGIALAAHGCILTPATVSIVVLAGNSMALFMLAILSMATVLVTNLAAMPTKFTIPIFCLSVLLDLGIILACSLAGFGAVALF